MNCEKYSSSFGFTNIFQSNLTRCSRILGVDIGIPVMWNLICVWLWRTLPVQAFLYFYLAATTRHHRPVHHLTTNNPAHRAKPPESHQPRPRHTDSRSSQGRYKAGEAARVLPSRLSRRHRKHDLAPPLQPGQPQPKEREGRQWRRESALRDAENQHVHISLP